MNRKTEENLRNICRPIVLFNNFLPTSKEKQGWDYMAFGTIDGVSIEDAIVSESSGEILNKLWQHQKKYSEKLKGKYAVQIVYALCYGEEEKEKEFWNDTEHPFTFFCRLQFKGDIGELKKNKSQIKTIVLKKYPRDVLIKIYTMYDNSDLLIVIKTKRYRTGTTIINSFHQNVNFAFSENHQCELKNSFTIFALRQDYINRTKGKEFVNALNKEKIEKVHINVIKREFNESLKWTETIDAKRKLKCEIDSEFVLGTDDEIVFIKDIGWGDFLKLYREDKGIFNNSSEEYQKCIAGTTTIICDKLDDDKGMFTEDKSKKENHENDNIDKINEIIVKLRQKLNCLCKDEKTKDTYKELYVILNTLPKFSAQIYSDYVFFVLLHPLKTLLDLLEEGFNDSYYEFIKNFSLLIQNSVKSDKHAMQIVDFNTKIYDIPSKLNAFYTAYIHNVSDILNIHAQKNKCHVYDFVVVPGVTNIVKVVELFQRVSVDKRLIRIEIPENRFYDIDNIMIAFAHEAGHYVGTAIRKREERYEHILYSISTIYIDYVISFLKEENGIGINISNVNWQNIVERCKNLLEKLLERETNQDYLMKQRLGESEDKKEKVNAWLNYNRYYKNYFSFLENNIHIAMSDLAEYMLPNIFGGLVFGMSEEKKNKVYEVLHEISLRFIERFEENTTMIRLDTVMEQLNILYEECFSDIVGITILDLDAKEYLNSMIKENKLQDCDTEYLSKTAVIYRISIVLNILFAQEEERNNNILEEDEYKKDRIFLLKEACNTLKNIEDGWQSILKPEEYRNCCFFALMNKAVYRRAHDYLMKCREEFIQQLEKDEQRKEKCREIRKFFSKYKTDQKSNIEEQISDMEKIIEVYKEKVFKELMTGERI